MKHHQKNSFLDALLLQFLALQKVSSVAVNSKSPLPKQKYGFDMANYGPYMGKIWDG